MSPAQIIVLATPVFLALMALEWLVGRVRGRDTYRLHDAIASIGLGMLSQVVALLTKLFAIGLYVLAYEHLAPWRLPVDAWWVWPLGLLGYDFCYYWKHRAGHRVALLWAAHVVHHQSEDYNLSTALRQTSSDWIAGWVFYLPLALLGLPPLVFGAVALVDLLYQFWVHTQQIGRLGWFDRWFCSPSNHRVHHAVNDPYIDKNYGGILIVWDRLFGTFEYERAAEPCVYGTRSPLCSYDPLWANVEVYAALLRESWRTPVWADKLRLWLAPPGWQPPALAQRFPKQAFDLRQRQRFDPPVGRGAQLAAAAIFVATLVATVVLLWQAHRLGAAQQLAALAGLTAALSLAGRLGRGRWGRGG